MAYQNPEGISNGHVVVPSVDYEKIRTFVLQVMEERGIVSVLDKADEKTAKRSDKMQRNVQAIQSEQEEILDFDEAAVNDILASLCMYR